METNVTIRLEYVDRPEKGLAELSEDQHNYLALRREKIRARSQAVPTDDQAWLARSFPVLAILAPVMSTTEEKIEFPGDPMCLYSALCYAVEQVVATRLHGVAEAAPYNDLCPQWGYLPSAEYRRAVDDNGIRSYEAALLNTDQTVFDPRVWNEKVKNYFVNKVLLVMRPRVVLISAVSPAHRYAIDIARTVRAHLPECLIVIGGRHTDETIHYDAQLNQVTFEPSSAVTKILTGALAPVFDFFIAGEGYYALDLLLKAIALAMDIETTAVTKAAIIKTLSEYAPRFGDRPGRALILALAHDQTLHAWPISGPKLDLTALPAPYKAFAVRARFPIFRHTGLVQRTAHIMVTNACTFHCYFCSEGVTVVGDFLSFRAEGIEKALERVVEYISYGAEALFFDDSIFWGGSIGAIVNFCRGLEQMRTLAHQSQTGRVTLFGYEIESAALLNLQWGAQLTVDFLASRRRPEESQVALAAMKRAGCVYIYIGIESMAETVITRVHKNINQQKTWEERVRTALGLARQAGILIGSSVLFGLDGETPATIEETIEKVEELLAEDLLSIASPNILTYHPNTEITALHEMKDKIDYHSAKLDNHPPYVYFEEAFPAVVSKNLTEDLIWHIHKETQQRWGRKRNANPMPDLILRDA